MMRERKKNLERLVAVKAQLHEREEARLAEIEQRRVAAQQDRDAMIGFLDHADAADGLLLTLACKRMVLAERGAANLAAQASRQQQNLARSGAQKRSAEKMLRDAAATLAREEEKRVLQDLAERLAPPLPTSLP